MAATTDVLTRDKLYIGGQWVDPAGTGTIEVVNPTTEQPIGTHPGGHGGGRRPGRQGGARGVRRVVADLAVRARRLLRGDRRRAGRARRRAGRADHHRDGDADRAVADDPGRPAVAHVRLDAAAGRGDRLGGGGRQLADRARGGRGGRRDHALELPAAPDRQQGRAGDRGRLHRRPEAQRGRAAERLRAGGGRASRSGCRPGSSTWSPARARWWARRSSPTPTRTWSASPAPRARASASRSSPRRASSRSRSSWAASRRT